MIIDLLTISIKYGQKLFLDSAYAWKTEKSFNRLAVGSIMLFRENNQKGDLNLYVMFKIILMCVCLVKVKKKMEDNKQ